MAEKKPAGVLAVQIAVAPRNCTTNVFKFGSTLQVEPKEWQPKDCHMSRADNRAIVECYNPVEQHGEGSEYGRLARTLARRKQRGYVTKQYRAEDQPWNMTIPTIAAIKLRQEVKTEDKAEVKTKKGHKEKGATVRRLRGQKEGGTSDNCDFWIFRKTGQGLMEATLVDEWYNFVPLPSHKTMNDEEAEENFTRRDRILNQFALRAAVMKGEKEDKEDGTLIKNEKSFVVKQGHSSGSDVEEEGDGEEERKEKRSKVKKKKGKKEKEGPISDEELYKRESSDGGEDGDEIDYMSDTSGESDTEVKPNTTIDGAKKGTLEENEERGDEAGIGDYFESGDDDSEEEDDEDSKDSQTKADDKNDRKVSAVADAATESDGSISDPDDDEVSTASAMAPNPSTAPLKRPIAPSPTPEISAKRVRIASCEISESVVRRCLLVQKVTSKELMSAICQKYPMINVATVQTQLSAILMRINVQRRRKLVDGKEVMQLWLDP